MKIAMMYINLPELFWDSDKEKGVGGSESGFIKTVEYLRRFGHEVHAFTRAPIPRTTAPDGSVWCNIDGFDKKEQYDVFYSLRHQEPFEPRPNAKLTVLFLADTESHGLGDKVKEGKIDLVTSVSCWQGKKIADEEHIHGENMLYSSNGVESDPLTGFDLSIKEPGRCMFSATPERGLGTLLDLWPEIRNRVPFATLHLFSSILGWGASLEDNKNMWKDLYDKADGMETLGVTNHIHSPRWAMVEQLKRTDTYIYPSSFRETCCMSVLEGQLYGVIPVTTCLAALAEKVINGLTGFAIPPYGVDTNKYRSLFVDRVVEVLTMDEDEKLAMRKNCMRYAKQFTYGNLVRQWADEWEMRIRNK